MLELVFLLIDFNLSKTRRHMCSNKHIANQFQVLLAIVICCYLHVLALLCIRQKNTVIINVLCEWLRNYVSLLAYAYENDNLLL
jgi:hypothetical protein